jgi:hypothetical protein
VIRRAGFPADVFQTLLIGSAQVARVIDDPRVKAASLTGSEPAGAQVAAQAGRQLKKTVLELGGSDPFVVMPSADLERAVRTAVDARVINNGQSCIAAKRFLVDARIAAEFERRFVEAMEALRIGDPMDESTQLGPLATPEILEGLDQQVRATVAAGARLLTGGHRIDRPGNFYAPTVLADVPEGFAGLSRGVVRTGGRALPHRGHRRGDPSGQRHRIRIGRERVDQRRGRAAQAGGRDRSRHGLRQRHGGVRPAAAFRRREALGIRPRVERLRNPRVRQREDRAGA